MKTLLLTLILSKGLLMSQVVPLEKNECTRRQGVSEEQTLVAKSTESAMDLVSASGVSYQPPTTPEREEEIVYEQAKRPIAPLSEALYDLIQGISDQTFDKVFFDKIRQAERSELTGEYVDHWPNGQLKIKAPFKVGKVDGHVHGWFPDGLEAFKGFYYENKKAGVHIAFYPEGGPKLHWMRIARVHRYDFEGRLDGRQHADYVSGQLKSLVRYRHGVLHGAAVSCDAEGNTIKAAKYEDGNLVTNTDGGS